MNVPAFLLTLCLLPLSFAGCSPTVKEAAVSSSPAAQQVGVQNTKHSVTFRVVQAPAGSSVDYKYGKVKGNAVANGAWETTVKAWGGDRIYLSCSPPVSTIGNGNVDIQILVNGQVEKKISNPGYTATIVIEGLPAPAGFATPTPSNEDLKRQMDDLQGQQNQETEERLKNEKERENADDKQKRADDDKRDLLQFNQRQLDDMKAERRQLERSRDANASPEIAQGKINELDRRIDQQQRQVDEIQSRR